MPAAGYDSRRVYEVWQQVVRDESLYDALTAGTHRDHALARAMSAEDLAILDELQREPGLRWNVENLRFRATHHVLTTLRVYLPISTHVLTRGDEDWLRDLVYEYLSHHRWDELGRRLLAECARFGEFVRGRVGKRRALPELVEHALAVELGVVELLRRAGEVPADGWGRRREPLSDAELLAARPRLGPAVRILEVPVDFTEWLNSGDPTRGQPKPQPVTLLVTVPSPDEPHRTQRLSEGARLVLDRCVGERTSAELARAVHEELELEEAGVLGLLRKWLAGGTLRA
jgi:hypothetical protein